jgi:mRNA-degrading endonuclease YafQ of YafQ-DinJ toxin-antitoxin module
MAVLMAVAVLRRQTMDLNSAAALGTMLSTAVTALKDARELAKSSGDHELKAKIGDAYDCLIDLRMRLIDYDDEVRKLRQELAKRDAFEGPVPPHNYVYKTSDREHPLCPNCFQSKDRKISYMSALEDWNGGKRRTCGQCRWVCYEQPMDDRPKTVKMYRA